MTDRPDAAGRGGATTPVAPEGHGAILGLGSNMGDKRANLAHAIDLLLADGSVRLVARSRDWRTPPWGVTDQDWFVNACIAVSTDLAPRELLRRCQDVEQKMARIRTRHWGPRIIDVDILTYGDRGVAEPDLVIPHPRIAERAFVLGPLSDIAPALVIGGQTVAARLAAIDKTGVTPIE